MLGSMFSFFTACEMMVSLRLTRSLVSEVGRPEWAPNTVIIPFNLGDLLRTQGLQALPPA